MGGPCTFESHERAIPRLLEKPCVDERAQERTAEVALEAPQPLRLSRCQPKTRHLYELPLNPLKDVVDTHGF